MENPPGYQLHPSRYPNHIGYSKLDVYLSGKPEERYFDASDLYLPITHQGRLNFSHITRYGESPGTQRFFVGPIKLQARHGEVLQAFSFGGDLLVALEDGFLHCTLTSPAPIFSLKDDPHAPEHVLIEELQDLGAELRAKLDIRTEEHYLEKLSKTDPYQLFLSSLVTLRAKLDHVPASMHNQGNYQHVSNTLNKIIQTVKSTDGWPKQVPNFHDLLVE